MNRILAAVFLLALAAPASAGCTGCEPGTYTPPPPPPPEHYGCAKYPDGNATNHWELYMYLRKNNPSFHDSVVVEAVWARILVDADLCDHGQISFKEYQARVLETIARR